jgi:hypothetical protein
MTSFYNRFLLDTTKENNNNVLKQDYTIDYSNYEKLKIAEQYNKLYSNIYNKNNENIFIEENKKIYNLSINDLLKKSGIVYISLLNDLSIFFSSQEKNKTLNKLGLILTKDDNLLYIGILILFISFLLWLIDISK